MFRAVLLSSACVGLLGAAPAFAQAAAETTAFSDIIVTATKRSAPLSSVPIAVSAVGTESLERTGASDIRQLNQLSPSLFVSSTSSEASSTAARIRGIGTIGDNPGLEASVATFIDGVYRARSGVGLTELGEIDHVEVLRGPQGTLFGRNASAGLINIQTARPSFTPEGKASLTYGNYRHWRATGSITGAVVEDKVAARLDGVYVSRDGFITDRISGRRINGRDRFLVRGQMLFTPNDDLELRVIGDYTKRKEECCVGAYLPFRTTVKNANSHLQTTSANAIVDLIRSLGGDISDDTYKRETMLSPGRSLRSNVQDWGVSAELKWDFTPATLTSITSYRDWKVDGQQDADFTVLDLIVRDNYDRRFRTFSQELRLNGTLFDDRIDWLVGAYYAHEKLNHEDDLHFGRDYMTYADGLVRLQDPTFPGYSAIAAMIGQPGDTLNGRGGYDHFRQASKNYAFFTHNMVKVTDRLSLTLGGRYTNEKKTLDLNLRGNNTLCGGILASGLPSGLASAACAVNQIIAYDGSSVRKDDEFTGTAVLSYKPVDELMLYGSYSRGYKAGGFNLDRAGFNPANISMSQLQFAPEKVSSFEIGAKLNLSEFRLNIAGFHAVYENFQLNTFNGTNFVVANIQSCKDDLRVDRSCAADKTRGGVTSTGVEAEAQIMPAPNVYFDLGATIAKTKYRDRLVGTDGSAIPPVLVLLPGQFMSNAPEYVLTGAATWTPQINDMLNALLYVDFRYQSGYNTGSDLFPEKWQQGFILMNARVGVSGAENRWSLELWAQNLLNTKYVQTAFNTPLQGSGSAGITALTGAPATTLFSGFLGEPRTYGVTVRTKF